MKTTTAVPASRINSLYTQWRQGKPLSPMAKRLHVRYQDLRGRFITLAGGRRSFLRLRRTGAGAGDTVPAAAPVARRRVASRGVTFTTPHGDVVLVRIRAQR